MYGDKAPGRPHTRAMLVVSGLSQAMLSAALLFYIHRTAVILGDYGPTWRAQLPGFVTAKP